MNFIKYHGTGNDFIIINARDGGPFLAPTEMTDLCRRNTGIGADGIIFVCNALSGVDASMRIFNADGSEAEMCGNGIRCLSKYLYEREGLCKESMLIETLAGIKVLALKVEGGLVTEVEVDMGLPDFDSSDLPLHQADSRLGEVSFTLGNGEEVEAICLSMGNPHCVIFVDDIVAAPLQILGPVIERYHLFPSRTNVEFVQIVDTGHLKIRVWERGVGETASCGTGACAAFTAAMQTGKGESPMLVTISGGELKLKIDEHGHILMAGPAVEVYSGTLSPYWNG